MFVQAAIYPSELSGQDRTFAGYRSRLGRAHDRLPPALLMLLAVIAVELAWALATVVFSDLGAAGTALLSTGFAAVVFTVASPPRIDDRLQRHWLLVLLFGLADACMSLSFLFALKHEIPLGIATTIAFLGPLGLAVVTSRRAHHFLWIGIALLGIALLTPAIGDHLSVVGLCFAAMSALAWAAFVPLTKLSAQAFGGSDGLTFSLWVSTLILVPFALAEGSLFQADFFSIAGCLVVALLGTVVPTAVEFRVLQRISALTYGILVTLEPAVGALVGAALLGQAIGPQMWIAVACVTVAAMGITIADSKSKS